MISCTTEEAISLSSRASESIEQALVLTHQVLQTYIMTELRNSYKMEALYTVTDSVALLDMLTSFADLISLSAHVYTRPVLVSDNHFDNDTTNNSSTSSSMNHTSASNINTTTNINNSNINSNTATNSMMTSPLIIHAGRHPILSENPSSATCLNTSFQSNDMSLSHLSNFLVITGTCLTTHF